VKYQMGTGGAIDNGKVQGRWPEEHLTFVRPISTYTQVRAKKIQEAQKELGFQKKPMYKTLFHAGDGGQPGFSTQRELKQNRKNVPETINRRQG